jgi:hypothetical protein
MDEALRLTERTIEARSARFRDLIVGLVVVAVVSLVCALVCRSWKPLLGLYLLVPLSGGFMWSDAALVDGWRRRIAALWRRDGLNLDIFSTAVRGMPIFPPRTLGGMLAVLPTTERGITAAALSSPMREALAGTMDTIGHCQGDRTALATLAHTIGLASLSSALLLPSWLPMVGLLLIPPIRGAGHGIAVLRFRRRWRRVRELLPGDGERRALVEAAARLDWNPIPATTKQKLLGSLGSAEKEELDRRSQPPRRDLPTASIGSPANFGVVPE